MTNTTPSPNPITSSSWKGTYGNQSLPKANRAKMTWNEGWLLTCRIRGYEYRPDLNNQQALLANVRTQLQTLNNLQFSDGEWLRFVETYLDKPSEGIVDTTRKIHDDYIHDFVFDDGHIESEMRTVL